MYVYKKSNEVSHCEFNVLLLRWSLK